MADRRRPPIVLPFAAACACVFLSFVFLPKSSIFRPWKGASLLAVKVERPEREVLSALSGCGVKDLVSESRQSLAFSDFDEWESVQLPDLDKRLMKEDPRRDAYMERLGEYFEATDGARSYRLFYLIDASMPGSTLRSRLKKAFGTDADWMLMERGAKKSWLEGAIAWIALTVIFSIATPKRSRLALLSPIAWIGIFLSSSWPFLLACLPALCLAFSVNIAFIRYPYEKIYTIRSMFMVLRKEIGAPLFFILAIGSFIGFFLYPLSHGLAVMASFGLAVTLQTLEKRIRRKSIHPIFAPLPLRTTRSFSPSARGDWRFLLVAAVFSLFFSVLAFFSISFHGAAFTEKSLLSFPYPHGYTGPGSPDSRLPNYRDYLGHLEYQAGFLEADLSDSRPPRAFTGYSRNDDGSLSETNVTAPRLSMSERPRDDGIERMLRLAGEKALIMSGPWNSGGTSGSEGNWPVPYVVAALLFALAASGIQERAWRMRRR